MRARYRRLAVMLVLAAAVSCGPSTNGDADEATLFSGITGFTGHRFGSWLPGGNGLIYGFPDQVGTVWHAETAQFGIIGADFTYSAEIDLARGDSSRPLAEGHLQFRITVGGRYGVALRVNRDGRDVVQLYKFARTNKNRSDLNTEHDEPDFIPLGDEGLCPLFPDRRRHTITVKATGASINVDVDGIPVISFVDDDVSKWGEVLEVGRFGLYVFSPSGPAIPPSFSNVYATADTMASSNFALLYSTAGYEFRARSGRWSAR